MNFTGFAKIHSACIELPPSVTSVRGHTGQRPKGSVLGARVILVLVAMPQPSSVGEHSAPPFMGSSPAPARGSPLPSPPQTTTPCLLQLLGHLESRSHPCFFEGMLHSGNRITTARVTAPHTWRSPMCRCCSEHFPCDPFYLILPTAGLTVHSTLQWRKLKHRDAK